MKKIHKHFAISAVLGAAFAPIALYAVIGCNPPAPEPTVGKNDTLVSISEVQGRQSAGKLIKEKNKNW